MITSKVLNKTKPVLVFYRNRKHFANLHLHQKLFTKIQLGQSPRTKISTNIKFQTPKFSKKFALKKKFCHVYTYTHTHQLGFEETLEK